MADSIVSRRFVIVGIVAPILVTLMAIAAQLVWLPQTPEPIAVHWGLDGVDGSGPGWTYPFFTLVLGVALPLWLWFSGVKRLRGGAGGWSFRFLAATSLGLAVFASVMLTWSVRIQVGLDSWQDAPSITPGIVAATLLGIGAGLVGYLFQPKQEARFAELPKARIDVATGERIAWLGTARASKGAVAVVIGGVVLLLAGSLACWLAGETAVAWLLIAIAVLIAGLGLTMTEADVRVDSSGVEVRGPAGWPRSRIALNEVATATAVNVEALGSFGGWGWRRVPGALGVVLRSGEALRVERKEGHALVVTVDDAATAAALLTALASRTGE